ncbi:MAG: oligoendopeptidase F [Chlamydiae bacterium RIFCSPHIGHO2_12_FULL_49_11]|nr:MAG: oligoendopeptidase F [Chlamydiae bacterium RIFCSPHIGHO2_12_FULL_49_11]
MEPEKSRWDLTLLFKNEESVNKSLHELLKIKNDISIYRGKLAGKEALLDLLRVYERESRQLEKLYSYAHLYYDADLASSKASDLFQRAHNLFLDFRTKTAWMRPELLSLDASYLVEVSSDPEFAPYKFMLEKIVREKKHTLSEREEEIFSEMQSPLEVSQNVFTLLNNVNFVFNDATDSDGQKHPLTHATRIMHRNSADPKLRQTSYTNYLQRYSDHGHAMSELLAGHVRGQWVQAKLRGFSSCLEARLYSDKIDSAIYKTLLEEVHVGLPVLHDYIALKKKMLGKDELYPYDLAAPLGVANEKRYSYDEAVEIVLEALSPMDEEYRAVLKDGLCNKRWVDRYERPGKKSGAYSWIGYDAEPYILLNFAGDIRNVLTLAHEAGHSMHTYLSKKQTYFDATYPIFLGEIASTFHENMVNDYLIRHAESRSEKIALLISKLEDMRNTFFRQAMFAEFELWMHEEIEKRETLSFDTMRSRYRALNKAYFGPALTTDDLLGAEYLIVPHFYRDYYVYQYATGIAASTWLYKRVKEDALFLPRYRAFLESGGKMYPTDLLETLGLDLKSKQPYREFVAEFKMYVDLLKKELDEKPSV